MENINCKVDFDKINLCGDGVQINKIEHLLIKNDFLYKVDSFGREVKIGKKVIITDTKVTYKSLDESTTEEVLLAHSKGYEWLDKPLPLTKRENNIAALIGIVLGLVLVFGLLSLF